MSGKTPALRTTINSVTYAVDFWQTVQQGQILQEVWRDGFIGGANDYKRSARDTYQWTNEMDASRFPWMRLQPGRKATHVLANLDPQYPVYARIGTETGGSTKYVFVWNGRYGYKFSASMATLHTTKDFGAGAICGHPAFFEGVWNISLGATVTAVRLTTIGAGAGADTYTAIPDSTVALHFAGPIQKDGLAQIARAHSTNNIDLSADTTVANGGFGGDFEAGDSGIPISELDVIENELMIVKPDNIYRMDTGGNAYRVQGFISLPQITAYDGSNSLVYGRMFFWAAAGGLWRADGSAAEPIDPRADERWVTTPYLQDAYYTGAVTALGRWLYWAVGNQLWFGYIRDGGTVHWHGSVSGAIGRVRPQIVTADITVGPLLILAGSGNLYVWQLAQDGSMRTDLGVSRGAASILYDAAMPETDFGEPEKIKQIRRAWIVAAGLGATAPLTLYIARDRVSWGSANAVGAAITSAGYTERTMTPGTNDTAKVVSLLAEIATTAGYNPAALADPRFSEIGIEAATAMVYQCDIPVSNEGQNAISGVPATQLQALRNLRNGAHVTCSEPYLSDLSLDTWTGKIVGHSERALNPDDGYGAGYMASLQIERFNWGS
jgi:hypothetical protein